VSAIASIPFVQAMRDRWEAGRQEYGGTEFHTEIGCLAECLEEIVDAANYTRVAIMRGELAKEEGDEIGRQLTAIGERLQWHIRHGTPKPGALPPHGKNCKNA
jgi:hypothetical protein